jgi:hypothetical protein
MAMGVEDGMVREAGDGYGWLERKAVGMDG